MLKGERTRLQRYAIESTPARVYEGCCTWFTILVLSAIILAKTPSEHTQRGFSCFWGPKKCTKVAPKMHQSVTRPYLGRFCVERLFVLFDVSDHLNLLFLVLHLHGRITKANQGKEIQNTHSSLHSIRQGNKTICLIEARDSTKNYNYNTNNP